MFSYRNSTLQTYYSSPTETTLAFYSSKGGVQARVPSAPLVGWTNTDISNFDIQLTADTGRPHIRSASETICVIPHTHNSFGDTSFSAVGPRVWNALPSHLWQDMNYRHFDQALMGYV